MDKLNLLSNILSLLYKYKNLYFLYNKAKNKNKSYVNKNFTLKIKCYFIKLKPNPITGHHVKQ